MKNCIVAGCNKEVHELWDNSVLCREHFLLMFILCQKKIICHDYAKYDGVGAGMSNLSKKEPI